ncbi:hypothetical protein TD95_003125 [Thielaviopsis punctulata]|uniref:ER membrane protein complex subunit 4 n=1 Tax=Thielaviopsis punctulata TaxID=72032 RepID=A0A0F4Z8B5_9PEZI|nr:hypothetical protein TD95_003125 [Thielaviopsis punctulata]
MASSIPSWVANLQAPPAFRAKANNIVDPPLYPTAVSGKKNKESKALQREQPTPEEMDTLKLKKAWEVALAPVKGLPMTAFMMYMSGNSLQIFSIMMVVMAFKNPLVGLMNTNQAFERFVTERNSGDILQVKLLYVVCQLVALAVGIWKVNSMGLLPPQNNSLRLGAMGGCSFLLLQLLPAMPDLRPDFDSLLQSHESASVTKPYHFKLDDVDDAFLREAYRIESLTAELSAELHSVRKAYLSTAPPRKSQLRHTAAAAAFERIMSDHDREQVDANAKQMIRELNASIRALDDAEHLRRETQAAVIAKQHARGLGALGTWAAGGGLGGVAKSAERVAAEEAAGQTAVHRDGVLWLLRVRLEGCCKVQQDMMEKRLSRELEKSQSLLGRSAGGGMGIPLPGARAVPLWEEEGRMAAGAGAGYAGQDLTQEQIQMFEQGNRAMMEHYTSTLDKVRDAEKSLVEISELQSLLVSNLATQSAQIDQLVADSVNTTENVGGGNKELRKATQRPSAARYTFFAASGLCAFLIVWDLII